ncbi:MAG: hypothetical protein AABN33_26715 [Acidobacteriota bacterium]
MNIKPVARLLYGFFAIVFLIVGATVLLLHTGILPDGVEDIVLGFGNGDLNAVHLIQELGSVLVFVGLITFWFIRHYEQSKTFHWAMTTFWSLFALVHWFDVGRPRESVWGPLINTLPFLLFLFVGLLRARSDGKITAEAEVREEPVAS